MKKEAAARTIAVVDVNESVAVRAGHLRIDLANHILCLQSNEPWTNWSANKANDFNRARRSLAVWTAASETSTLTPSEHQPAHIATKE